MFICYALSLNCSVYLFKPESRLDFDLLRTSRDGDSFQVRRVLDSGRVHVDCMDEEVMIGINEKLAKLSCDC